MVQKMIAEEQPNFVHSWHRRQGWGYTCGCIQCVLPGLGLLMYSALHLLPFNGQTETMGRDIQGCVCGGQINHPIYKFIRFALFFFFSCIWNCMRSFFNELLLQLWNVLELVATPAVLNEDLRYRGNETWTSSRGGGIHFLESMGG